MPVRGAVIAIAAAGLIGCGGKTPLPPPPPPQLQMTCPAQTIVEATSPHGSQVQFDAPVPTGGQAPYKVECTPGSGSNFTMGEHEVQCIATDAGMGQVACGFTVSVRVSKTLSQTSFVAFGDSITDGAVSLAPLIMLGPPDTYPFKLEQLLVGGYPSQTITVINEGKGGEKTTEGARRIGGVLDALNPDAVLILEGVNAVRELSTSTQANAIRTMILESKSRDVEVIIATVMPVTPNFRHISSSTLPKIRALNERIFELAAEFEIENVVDLYTLFDANQQLIGADGIHPTLEGQTRIAEAFRDEITRRYEVRSSLSSRRPRRALTRVP